MPSSNLMLAGMVLHKTNKRSPIYVRQLCPESAINKYQHDMPSPSKYSGTFVIETIILFRLIIYLLRLR